MNLTTLWPTFKLGLKSLLLHKLRSTLTVLGVVFGVASVIVMLAVGEGARDEALRQIEELGATNIILRSVEPSEYAGGEQTGARRYGLTLGDIRRIEATLPTLRSLVAQRQHRRRFVRRRQEADGLLMGISPAYQSLKQIRLARGRLISPLDELRASPVAVLSADIAVELFPLEDPLGKSVRVGEDRYFRVIGVARPTGGGESSGDDRAGGDFQRTVYIPFRTDRAYFGEVISFDRTGQELPKIVEVSEMTLAVDRAENVKETAMIVDSFLEDHHPQNDTAMTVPLELLERAERTQRMFTLVLAAIASISLLVGGIGIMNIMLATVMERTREIGIRRALGARQRDILWQFLVETMVLSGCGGLLGVALGVGVSLVLNQVPELTTIIRLWSTLLAVCISVSVGLVFGLYPARRAARLTPVEALRHT